MLIFFFCLFVSFFVSSGLQFVFSLVAKFEKSEALLRETQKSLLVLDVLRGYERVIIPTVAELAAAKRICNTSLLLEFTLKTSSCHPILSFSFFFFLAGLGQEKEDDDDMGGHEDSEETLRAIFVGCDRRLPFHTVMSDPWSILAVHLNEETVSALLPLAVPLEISSDKMYMLVIQNLVNKVALFFLSFSFFFSSPTYDCELF